MVLKTVVYKDFGLIPLKSDSLLPKKIVLFALLKTL